MKHLALTRFSLCLAAALAAAAAPVRAQDPMFHGTLRPGWQMESGNRMTALHLTLSEGWKTYWRSPGDNGIPPSFDWSGSQNVRAVRFHWPRPEVFDLAGERTIGYAHQLVLPMEVVPIDASRPVHLQAQVELGVCRDICVPVSYSFAMSLPGPGTGDDAIRAALRQRPSTAKEAGVTSIGCTLTPVQGGLQLDVAIELPSTGGAEVVVVEPAEPGVWVSASQMRRTGGRLEASMRMAGPANTPLSLQRDAMTVTVLGRNRAVEIKGCPAPG